MEAIFALVKALGNNNTEGVVKLLKDAELLSTTGQEEYLRSLFHQPESIEYEQFHEAMKKFSTTNHTTLQHITDKLMQKAPPVLREFNSDRDIPIRRSTGSTETETELSNESFFETSTRASHSHT